MSQSESGGVLDSDFEEIIAIDVANILGVLEDARQHRPDLIGALRSNHLLLKTCVEELKAMTQVAIDKRRLACIVAIQSTFAWVRSVRSVASAHNAEMLANTRLVAELVGDVFYCVDLLNASSAEEVLAILGDDHEKVGKWLKQRENTFQAPMTWLKGVKSTCSNYGVHGGLVQLMGSSFRREHLEDGRLQVTVDNMYADIKADDIEQRLLWVCWIALKCGEFFRDAVFVACQHPPSPAYSYSQASANAAFKSALERYGRHPEEFDIT